MHVSFAQFCKFQFTDSIDSIYSISVHSNEKSPEAPPALHKDLVVPMEEFNLLFAILQGLPPQREHGHHIHLLPGSQPVIVKEILTEGIIQPNSSPFSSPVLLVRKEDGTWKFCVDYRALNTITVKDRFPIPMVDELLDELHGSRIFSDLDLRYGYHQLHLAPGVQYKTTFKAVDCHFELLVMSFGLTNAPSTFQAAINSIIRTFLRKLVLVFFDDILVYSKDWQTHLHHMQQVIQTLAEH